MGNLIWAAVLAVFLAAGPASAATVPAGDGTYGGVSGWGGSPYSGYWGTLNRFSAYGNAGVYALSEETAKALGVPGATHFAFVNFGSGRAGMRFNEKALLNAVSKPGEILGVFNGFSDALTYRGKAFDPLGETVIGTGTEKFIQGFGFAFHETAGALHLKGQYGKTKFHAKQAQGYLAERYGDALNDANGPSPVPLPAGLPLILMGMASLVLLRRRAA